MSDPRYPGSPGDPYQPAQPASQQPTEWESQQPTDWQAEQPAEFQSEQPATESTDWQAQQPADWQAQQPAQPGWQPQQPAPGGWQPSQMVPAPKPKRNWLGPVVAVAILAVLAGGFILLRDRLSAGVDELAAGACIDEPATNDAISDVQRQPCNEPHDGEVFAVIRHTAAGGAPYPPISEFEDLVSNECLPQIVTYTGRTLLEIDAAGLSFSYFYPTASSWASGDRGITCFITREDDQKMVGSIRAAGGTSAPAATRTP